MKNQFLDYLEKTSLEKKDKSYIQSIFEYFEGECPQIFSNRIFLLEGDPGIGKTFLAKKLIHSLDLPTIYFGQSKLEGDKIISVNSIDNLFKKLKNFNEGVVYLDDLKFLFDFNEEGFDLDNKHRKLLMNLLEFFRDNDNKTILILTTNDSSYFEDSFKDRIDVEISFDLPSETDKHNFLINSFQNHIDPDSLLYLARNSMGYNYRDLPNLVKLAYFHGNKKITRDSIITALKEYIPSSLLKFNVNQGIKLKLDNLYLEKELKENIKNVITTISRNKELLDAGVSRHNLFIFEGPAGVGKTYCAMAIAGELGIPLLKPNSREIHMNMASLFTITKRFGNSVILIDDADKIFGRSSLEFDDGDALFADLNKQIDDLEGKNGIVILSANDTKRFGKALNSRFKSIKFDYPSSNQRRLFFENLFKKSKIKIKFKPDIFISFSKGKNFRDMQMIWNEFMFYAVNNKKRILTEEDFDCLFRNTGGRYSLSMVG